MEEPESGASFEKGLTPHFSLAELNAGRILKIGSPGLLVYHGPELGVASSLPVLLQPNPLSWGEVPGGLKVTSPGHFGIAGYSSTQPPSGHISPDSK